MSKFATKAAANMFCQARYEAAKTNAVDSRTAVKKEAEIKASDLEELEESAGDA